MKNMEKEEGNNRYERIIAVTDRTLCGRPFLEQMERVCRVHPAAVILREKDLPEEAYGRLAEEVSALCKRYEVPCILHFYPQVAEKLGARVLHLPLWKLREWSGGHQIIGCSIHSVEEAMEAEALGAGYLIAGHIYATDCKKGVPARGLGFLREVCSRVSIPVYAIGGIQLEKLQEIQECGAAGGCMMSGMMRI